MALLNGWTASGFPAEVVMGSDHSTVGLSTTDPTTVDVVVECASSGDANDNITSSFAPISGGFNLQSEDGDDPDADVGALVMVNDYETVSGHPAWHVRLIVPPQPDGPASVQLEVHAWFLRIAGWNDSIVNISKP